MRAGIVGAGRWARTLAAKLEGVGVRVVAHSRREALSAPGMGVLISPWGKLVSEAGIDLVVAATSSPELNAEVAAAAVQRGAAVLCTKPVDLPAGMLEPGALKAPLVVDFVHLFSPCYRALKERLAAEPGKEITGLSVSMLGPDARRIFPAWLDYGIHAAAICRDLLGVSAPASVREAWRGSFLEACLMVGGARVRLVGGEGPHMRSVGVERGEKEVLRYSEGEARSIGSRAAWLTGEDAAILRVSDPHDPLTAMCSYVARVTARRCTSTYFVELARAAMGDLVLASEAASRSRRKTG